MLHCKYFMIMPFTLKTTAPPPPIMFDSDTVLLYTMNRLITKGILHFRLTSDQFETMRIYSVLVIIAFRLVMMPNYLQSYLNLAYHKMEEMKLEAGKISNIELQKTLSRVFYYLCVVSRGSQLRKF